MGVEGAFERDIGSGRESGVDRSFWRWVPSSCGTFIVGGDSVWLVETLALGFWKGQIVCFSGVLPSRFGTLMM